MLSSLLSWLRAGWSRLCRRQDAAAAPPPVPQLQPLTDLTAALRSPVPDDRLGAYAWLAAHPDHPLPTVAVLDGLQHPNEAVVHAAIDLLTGRGVFEAAEAIAEALQRLDRRLLALLARARRARRRGAAPETSRELALVPVVPRRAVRPLRLAYTALPSPVPGVVVDFSLRLQERRERATRRIGQLTAAVALGIAPCFMVGPVLAALAHCSSRQLSQALTLAGTLPPALLAGPLRQLLPRLARKRREAVVRALLAQPGSPLVDELLNWTREETRKTLAAMAPPPDAEPLTPPDQRQEEFRQVLQMRRRRNFRLDILNQALHATDARVRAGAVLVMADHLDLERTRPVLEVLVHDADPEVREAVLSACLAYGRPDLPFLEGLTRDAEPGLRARARFLRQAA